MLDGFDANAAALCIDRGVVVASHVIEFALVTHVDGEHATVDFRRSALCTAERLVGDGHHFLRRVAALRAVRRAGGGFDYVKFGGVHFRAPWLNTFASGYVKNYNDFCFGCKHIFTTI